MESCFDRSGAAINDVNENEQPVTPDTANEEPEQDYEDPDLADQDGDENDTGDPEAVKPKTMAKPFATTKQES